MKESNFQKISQIITFSELDSTSDYLWKYAHSFPENTVIIAKRQTRGRGRGKRAWESDIGGLWFSLLRKKDYFPQDNLEILNFIYEIPLTLIKVLENLGLNAQLKWPNDVMLEGKKLSGLLPELSFKGKKIEKLIIGCGINVKNKLPVFLSNLATSLENYLSKNKLKKFPEFFFQKLDSIMKEVENKKLFPLQALKKYWWGIGKEYTLKDGKGKFYTGIILEIDSKANLILQLPSGKIKKFSSGEIFFLN